MWPALWAALRTYAPYVTFPVAFVVGAVGYHVERGLRGRAPPEREREREREQERSIAERREERRLRELAGAELPEVASLKDRLEFAPRAVLERNRPEKS